MIFRVTHINLTMPEGGEAEARRFYGELLDLPEVVRPAPLRDRGGLWFELAGFDLHLSTEDGADPGDRGRHIGVEATNIGALRKRLESHGIETEDGREVPWKRFFARDPFGNRLEFHEPGGLRGLYPRDDAV